MLRYRGIRSTSTIDRNRNDAVDGIHEVPSELSAMSGRSQYKVLGRMIPLLTMKVLVSTQCEAAAPLRFH